MVRKIKCLLGLHDWIMNSTVVILNGIRVCRKCNREEIVIGYKTKTIWVKYIK